LLTTSTIGISTGFATGFGIGAVNEVGRAPGPAIGVIFPGVAGAAGVTGLGVVVGVAGFLIPSFSRILLKMLMLTPFLN
jgi:hypothetical protein